eukprot:COSAG01_NODE_1485_length_10131_cov_10.500995_9_plen_196_part_00
MAEDASTGHGKADRNRGVIGIVNPQKTSHCDPPENAHGLCLANPCRVGFVGGVGSGKTTTLLNIIAKLSTICQFVNLSFAKSNCQQFVNLSICRLQNQIVNNLSICQFVVCCLQNQIVNNLSICQFVVCCLQNQIVCNNGIRNCLTVCIPFQQQLVAITVSLTVRNKYANRYLTVMAPLPSPLRLGLGVTVSGPS